MAEELKGTTVAFLVAQKGTEQVELTEPWKSVEACGGKPVLISTESGTVQAFDHLDRADTFPVDVRLEDARVPDYDALVLPGGVANPDFLRTSEPAVRFVRSFFDAGKPVAAICHAPWTLIEADVVRGRTLTSYPSVRTDIINAGGTWIDEGVVTCRDGDNTLITSRKPDDLAAFNAALVAEVAQFAHTGVG
ncbi:type 1 glutamine amidotransferase [Gordonia sp. zg691]|uniref:Type 1 glutamine amidotransferase n=1 Tax=Gordonia jinghuaiqii TaxID=2758710 RepID=A0A7D7QXN4_9ACTN|nr:type 1 glutamine amidotransferase domain-containing protein [Gordonia jinghuaiqii]MBD0860644.1 type 1 glutamine amidotransferase [Gordonia jinghuaiqii]MCR5978090.1 DJ-1/PfpI/YhbO family deglycase/protease [Gordonia jinghuaiqii]QMT01448.1 type 1 glutamine amidotransferase [Gordonia jinghuaiqii]